MNNLNLINTKQFVKKKYIGDPLNAAYIFSNYEADELLVLDINASSRSKCISFEFIKALANFTTVPLTIGGGVSNLKQIKKILSFGVEKVAIGQHMKEDFPFLKEASFRFGSSSITAILNIKELLNNNYEIYMGKILKNYDILEVAYLCQEAGAGELIINNIDRDGCKNGFNDKLLCI